MKTSNYHQANGIFVFCIQYLFNVLLYLMNGFVIFYKGRKKPANVLPDLILKVSQNTSPSKASQDLCICKQCWQDYNDTGKLQFWVQQQDVSDEIHRVNKHCLNDAFNLKSRFPSSHGAQIVIKSIQHWLLSLGLQQIFCIPEKHSQELFVHLLSLLRRSDCPINISCTLKDRQKQNTSALIFKN